MAFESKVIKSDASTTIATIAVDTVSGVDYPVSQLIVGADGSAKSLVTGSTGLPVDLVAGSALTALQLIDDVVYVDDADWSDGSSKHALVGGLYQSSPQSITDGDVGPLQVTANGYLIAALSPTDNAVLDAMVVDLAAIEVLLGTIDADTGAIKTAVEVIDNAISGSEMQVDVVASLPAGSAAIGKLAANSGVDIGDVDVTSIVPGVGATNLAKAEDAGHTSGDVGVMALSVRQNTAASTSGSDGDYQPLITDTNGRLHVIDVTAAPAVHAEDDAVLSGHSGVLAMVQRKDTPSSGAGTNADEDYTFLRVSNYGALWIQEIDPIEGTGDIAHDAADSGNPQKIGFKALAHGSNPSAVAANDRTNAYANRHGVPWVIGGHPNVIARTARVTDADGAQTDTAMITISGGSKIVITRISIVCDNANTGDTNCTVGFAASSLPSDAHTGTDDILADFQGVPAGGGITIGDGSGILGVGADGEDLRYTCEDPAGGSIVISVSYYTVES